MAMVTLSDRHQESDIPEPVVVKKTSWTPSFVWAIPILASLIGLYLIFTMVWDHGPTITIHFKTANGIEAGTTKVKYKGVDIGEVKAVTLSRDLGEALVHVELAKDIKPFAVADSRFWVVRPRVAAGGISGLRTMFYGTHIGADAGQSSKKRKEFIGLETPPAVTSEVEGRRFTLQADDGGSSDIGSPIYHRHVEVGEVVAVDLNQDGKGVTFTIFVQTPYDRLVRSDTRFWHASGVDVTLNDNGIKVKTPSLAALLRGGIAFDTPAGGTITTAAKEDTVYVLAADREQAVKQHNERAEPVVLYFDQSVRGLRPGAPVDFRGLTLGNVKSIGLELDPERKTFRMPVTIEIFIERLGERFREMMANGRPEAESSLVKTLVLHGLRAQLRTENVLTGQLSVALDFFPDTRPVRFDPRRTPPEMPTIAGSVDNLQSQVIEIAHKLKQIPFDRIGANLNKDLNGLRGTLESTEKLFQHINQEIAPEAKATLAEARKSLTDAQQTLSQDAPLVHDTRQAVHELTRTAQSLRVLADYLERHPESLLRGK